MTHNVHSTVRDLEVLAEKFAARSTGGSPMSKSAALNLITRSLLGDGHDWAAIKNAETDITSQRYQAAEYRLNASELEAAYAERMPNSAMLAQLAEESGLKVVDLKSEKPEASDVRGIPQHSKEQPDTPDVLTRDRFYILNKLEATGVPLRLIDFNNPAFFNSQMPMSVIREMEQDGLISRHNEEGAEEPFFELSKAGRTAFEQDPVEKKRRSLSEGMIKHLCFTALSHERGLPYEAASGHITLRALEARGLISIKRTSQNRFHARLTTHGKTLYERMMERELKLPPEIDLA